MDKKTAKILRTNDEIKNMCQSNGWHEAKMMLFQKIAEINDISNIAGNDMTTILADIKARKATVDVLLEWLSEVEGIAKNSDHIRKQFLEKQKADFIMHFDVSEQE